MVELPALVEAMVARSLRRFPVLAVPVLKSTDRFCHSVLARRGVAEMSFQSVLNGYLRELGLPAEGRLDAESTYRGLLSWLTDGEELPGSGSLADDFLVALDAFDLNDYARTSHFDGLGVSPPLDLPTRTS